MELEMIFFCFFQFLLLSENEVGHFISNSNNIEWNEMKKLMEKYQVFDCKRYSVSRFKIQ